MTRNTTTRRQATREAAAAVSPSMGEVEYQQQTFIRTKATEAQYREQIRLEGPRDQPANEGRKVSRDQQGHPASPHRSTMRELSQSANRSSTRTT